MSREDLDFLNPHEMEAEEPTEPQTLQECLDYAKEFQDFEPLESAIYDIEKKLQEAIEVITFMRDCATASGKIDFYIKQSNKALRILNKK